MSALTAAEHRYIDALAIQATNRLAQAQEAYDRAQARLEVARNAAGRGLAHRAAGRSCVARPRAMLMVKIEEMTLW